MATRQQLEQLRRDLDELRERERRAMAALEQAAELALFSPGLSRLESREPILRQMLAKAAGLVEFQALGIFLFHRDEDLLLSLCEPEDQAPLLQTELGAFIDAGSVAWALERNKAQFAMATTVQADCLLHGILTPARMRGVFLGVLRSERSDLTAIQLSLLSIVLQQGAQMLESYELYSLHRHANYKLAENVKVLHATRDELDQARGNLERQVAERTRELAEANAALTREIAERREAQERLRHRELTLRALFNASDNLIFMVDQDGVVLDCNHSAALLFEREPETLGGLGPRELLPPDAAEAALTALRKAVRDERPVYHHQDYRGRQYALKLFPVRLETGRVLVAMFGQDITERKRAEAALRESESRFRSLFEDSPISLWEQDCSELAAFFHTLRDRGVTDFHKHFQEHPEDVLHCTTLVRVVNVNKASLAMYQAAHKQELLDNLDALLNEESLPAFAEIMAALAQGAVHYEAESVNLDLAGERKDVLVHINVAPGYEQSLGKTIVSIQDTTARKAMERDLLQAKETAEAASKAKSVFLANMSHELRTPLNGILGLAQMLLGPDTPQEQKECLDSILDSARQILSIVNDLLDLSGIDEGRFALREQPFALREALRSLETTFAGRARDKGLRFELRVDKEIPDRFLGDVGRFKQLFINLLTNALKFTEQGFVRVCLAPGAPPQVSGQDRGETGCWLHCSVEDSGVGIPADRLPTIFESFTLGEDYLTKRYSGTGMGLTIARSIVQKMGGELWVQSEEGRGSSFFFSLRLRLDPGATDSGPLDEPPACGDAAGLRVLLVGDDPAGALFAGRMLNQLGHTMEVAADGDSARAHLAQGSWDLLLLESGLPGLDGLELTAGIRRGDVGGLNPALPIIALHPRGHHVDREVCLAAGMNECLAKPLEQGALLAALQRTLGVVTDAPDFCRTGF